MDDTLHVKKKTKRHRRRTVSWLWPMLFLAAGCLVYYWVHLIDYVLPTVISADEAIENPGLFSGERSRNSLRILTGLGPRVVGSKANEEDAPMLIKHEVDAAINDAHSSQNITFKKQYGSGAYFLGFKPGFVNVYRNIQNQLVMFEGSEGKHSILLNCHYDTVPSSDGATDDAIGCSIMLELIRVLSKSQTKLKHNVVFLFNGAEETPLQGSNLFLQDDWAKNCRIVLNLEGAGQGGRALLFQSGPENPWLFNYYYKYAPNQHGQVFVEELFQSGFIPSDTDFRIFRDFGKLIGLDFAFGRNGYVYHTRYDIESYIPAGSHQHLGENLLSLINSLGNAPEFEDMEKHANGEMVFYDYLGWFMIAYSSGAGIAINVISILLGILSIVLFVGRRLNWPWLPQSMGVVGKFCSKIFFCNKFCSSSDEEYDDIDDLKRDVKINSEKDGIEEEIEEDKDSIGKIILELSIATGARLLSKVLAIAVTAIIALIIDSAATLVMPWYSNVWLIFPLYWCPTLVIYGLVVHLVDLWRQKKRNYTPGVTAQLNAAAAQVPWIIAIFVLTCMGVRSSSLFVFPVMSSALTNIIIQLTPLYKTGRSWIWVYLFIHIPSLVFTMYITLIVYVMLLPISARSGNINGDLYIGIVTALAVFYVTSFAVPLLSLVRKQHLVYILLSLFCFVMIIVALSTDVGMPYRAGPNHPAPQRYWIMHSNREFYDGTRLRKKETGYFILNQDRNSPRTVPLKKRTIRSLEKDCNDELYCGLPFYMTRMIPLSSESSWVPGSAPIIPNPTELVLSSRCENPEATCKMKFKLKGPDRMTVTFSPYVGAELINWNIETDIKETGKWLERPFYYIHIVRGKIDGDFDLELEFNVTPEQQTGKHILDIGLAGNHAHHESSRTREFQEFINSFPKWAMMMGWISDYKLHKF